MAAEEVIPPPPDAPSSNIRVGAIPPPPDAEDRYGRAEIRQPPSTFSKILGTLISQGPPAVGMAGGAILGTPAGPAGNVAGAGLGYAAGNRVTAALQEMYRKFSGLPPKGSTVLGTAGEVVRDVGEGASMEMGGQIVGRGLQALRPRTPTPETQAARDAAARTGIELTPAAAQGSPALAQVQALPSRLPLGGGPARRGLERARESAQAGAERVLGPEGRGSLVDAITEAQATTEAIRRAQREAPGELIDQFVEGVIGTSRQGRLELGGSVQAAVREVAGSARRQASALYDQALGAGQTQVPLGRTHEIAATIAAQEERLRALGATRPRTVAQGLEGTSAPQIAGGRVDNFSIADLPRELIERYGLGRVGQAELGDVLAIQQRLRAAVRSAGDDVSRRQLRQLLDAVTDDIGAAGTPEVNRLLRDASQFYRREVAEDFARKGLLRKILDDRPGKVGAEILRTKDPEVIRALTARLPERQQQEVRRSVLEKMREGAVDRATGQVDPGRFEQALRAFGEENIGYLMGPQVRELDALRRTLRANFGPGMAEPAYERMLRGSATELAQRLSKGNARMVEDLATVWPTITPGNQRGVAQGLLTNTLEHAVDPVTGQFSVERFLRAKQAVPQPVWNRVLETQQSTVLRDLETVFQHIARTDRAMANPSGTGQALLSASQLVGIGETALHAAINPATGLMAAGPQLATLIGLPYGIGRFVFSPTGRRFLVAPNAPAGVGSPSGMAQTLYRLLASDTAAALRSEDLPEPASAWGPRP